MSAPARFGRYRVERRIGSGSFATVWLAHDEVLDAPVAVKVLADNWAHRLDVRERFEEEARILRRADSDRVVRVHDIGELDDGRPYFVMTYADRGSLADRLAEGPLPVPVALRYGADVARGLAVLHEVGVIHRDVNPANVLVRSGRAGVGDRVLVADLGLAKAAVRGSGFTLTVGTPGYMAPEQASGGGVTKRTDVYAVGALLWHLLTGAAPDPGGALPAASLPPAVDAVVRQALARRPEDRFPSAGTLADALDAAAVEVAADAGARPSPDRVTRAAAGTTGAAATPDPEPRPVPAPDDTIELRRPPAGRRRGRLLVVGVVLLLLAGAAGVTAWRLRQTRPVPVQGTGVALDVPGDWARQRQDGPWELTPYGLTGTGIGLVVAKDVAGWRDPGSATPGVFVGVGPPALTRERLHAGGPAAACEFDESRWSGSGLAGTVRRYQRCGTVAVDVVEAVLRPAGGDRVVYVQVKHDGDPAAADRVLASLTLGPTN